MTITLDLPEALIKNVMGITNASSKSDGIRMWLENSSWNNHMSCPTKDSQAELREYFGKFPDFDLNIEETRASRCQNW